MMCLAVPMKLESVDGVRGVAEAAGVTRDVDLTLIEDAQVGQYVLIHAGFAIERIDEEEAQKTLELLRELAEHMIEGEGEAASPQSPEA